MKLSPNFTLEELTRTSYPRLQDVPTELQVMNMVYLCAAVLQPLRDELGRPVSITLKALPAVDSVLFEHAKNGSRWLHVQTKRISQPRRLANFNYKV